MADEGNASDGKEAVGLTCEVCGKGGFKNPNALNMHQVSAHKKGSKMLGMQSSEGNEYHNPPLGDYSNLMDMMIKAGVPPGHVQLINAVYQNYDREDLFGLQTLLIQAGVSKDARRLILETWANYNHLKLSPEMQEKLQISGYAGKEGKQVGLMEQESMSTVRSAKEIQEELTKMYQDAMSGYKQQIEMARLAQQAKQFGVELPPALAPYASSLKEAETPKRMKREFPPDSGVFVDLDDETYAMYMLSYTKRQMNQQNGGNAQHNDIPLKKHEFPPGSGVILDLTDSDYARLLSEHSAHAQPKTDAEPEWVKTLKEQVKEQKEINERLRQEITTKKEDDLNDNINYLSDQNKKLRDDLNNLKNQDKMEVISSGYKDIKRHMDDLGLTGSSRSTNDEIMLKKMDNSSQMMVKSFDTIAKKVEQGSKLGGAFASLVEKHGQDLLNRVLPPKPEGVPVKRYSEDDFEKINEKLNLGIDTKGTNNHADQSASQKAQAKVTPSSIYTQTLPKQDNPVRGVFDNVNPQSEDASKPALKRDVNSLLSEPGLPVNDVQVQQQKVNEPQDVNKSKGALICHLCGRTFKSQTTINTHMQTHDGEDAQQRGN